MSELAETQTKFLRQHARTVGLEAFMDSLENAAKPAIYCRPTQSSSGIAGIGTSRLGGVPDLPPNIDWPTCAENSVMVFLAQINLREVPRILEHPLPTAGMLYFFIECADLLWCEQHTVVYFDRDKESLRQAQQPSSGQYREDDGWQTYRPCPLEYKVGISLPAEVENVTSYSNISIELTDKYDRLEKMLRGFPVRHESELSQILGYPIGGYFNSPFYEAQRVREGLDFFPEEKQGLSYFGDNATSIKEKMRDWRLLLQIGSHDETGMMWSDVGHLQFVIHNQDLQNRDFSKTQVTIHSG